MIEQRKSPCRNKQKSFPQGSPLMTGLGSDDMKIEKLNEHQIRCTLTKEDLAERHLKISELAYGSEKTKELFQDMMIQANMDFGFEAEDIPLMIEAIPLSPEKIVLIITKVDSPDELDIRFSNFTNSDGGDFPETETAQIAGNSPAHDLISLLEELKHELTEPSAEEDAQDGGEDTDQLRMFSFTDMDDAISASRAIASAFSGESTLYRDPSERLYHLFLHQSPHTAMEFNKISHTVSSYLENEKCSSGSEAYCREHCRPVLPAHAVETLAQIQ